VAAGVGALVERFDTEPYSVFSAMIKLDRARSPLYRRHILQENIRWKALDEIYKMYMLLHRSDLNISAKMCQTFSHFSANFQKLNAIFQHFSSNFAQILMRIFRNFAHNEILLEFRINSSKISLILTEF
jgi:hypothetical protein